MDDTEDNIRDDDADNDGNDDDDDDDEIEEVLEMDEIGSDTDNTRATTSAAASLVSKAHLCIQALQSRNWKFIYGINFLVPFPFFFPSQFFPFWREFSSMKYIQLLFSLARDFRVSRTVASPGFAARTDKDGNHVMGHYINGRLQGRVQQLLDDQ